VIEIVLVLAVTLAGGWLRFQDLGRDSLWHDEAFSLQQAGRLIRDMPRSFVQSAHPPLYHLLLRGVLAVGDSEAVLRSPSAAFGTLSIPLVFLFGRRLFGASVGLLAATLLAASPLHLWHSRDAKMYTLLTFEGLLSWYLLTSLLKSPKPWLWASFVVTSVATLFTHYYGGFLLAAQLGVAALLHRRGEIAPEVWRRLLMFQVAVVVLFLPWALYVVPSIRFEALRWIERVHDSPLRSTVGGLIGITVGRGPYAALRASPFLALVVVGLLRDREQTWRPLRAALRERAVVICLAYLVVPIAIMLAVSAVRPLLVSRHTLMTAPAVFLLVAAGLRRLCPDRLFAGACALLVLLALPGAADVLSVPRTPDFRGVVSLLAAQASPGDLVLFYPGRERLPVRYYERRNTLRVRWCAPAAQRNAALEIARCVRDARTVWVVSSARQDLRRDTVFRSALEGAFQLKRVDPLFRLQVGRFERIR
jgi:mannosyltransferase